MTTLAGYLEILDECALLTALQKYANDEARKRGSIPKYQVYNNALLTAYKGRGFATDRTDTKAWGRWVESAVGAHLLSMSDELDYEVYYWRVPSRNKDDNDKEEILVFANILFVIVLMFGNILLSFFFCNQLSQSHEVRYPKAGDFLVDNTEVGHRNRIPLWMFGLLY